MKIIILTSSTNIKYGAGMDRVIYNAKEILDKEFDLVLYLSAKNFYDVTKGVIKIILNNPFSFSFIIFNSLSSVQFKSNRFWKIYFYLSKICFVKQVFYWHEMPLYYENFKSNCNKIAKSIEITFKGMNILQLSCSEANKNSSTYFDKVPNVVNINNCIIPRKLNKNIFLSKFTVITVASIQELKGTDIWTEVAINVCKKNKEIQFLWCGNKLDQQMSERCLSKINQANLEDNILFLGKVEDAAVLTSTAHLYYCSSRMDSFPLAILEAMSQGKNIVYYDSGGVAEAVGNEGVFIPDFSIEQTVNAILQKFEEFKSNPGKVFNQALYDKFYSNYTPEIFVKKLKDALVKNI
jgi:glycosyltransferase involved in cell wall biosynthesis